MMRHPFNKKSLLLKVYVYLFIQSYNKLLARQNTDIYTMHKLIHGYGDIDTDGWFDKNVGAAVTRARADPLNVLSKNGNLELRRNFFTLRVPVVKDWKKVPHDIKNISVPGKFKSELKQWQAGARVEQRGNDART
jgi:hypothetical protein